MTAVHALPDPLKIPNLPDVAEALRRRHSATALGGAAVSAEALSFLLWSGGGVNRPQSGRLTAPTAMNLQEIRLYAVTADGACAYDRARHALKEITAADLRAAVAGGQSQFATVPLAIVIVADTAVQGRSDLAAMDAGLSAGNILLAASALGLGARVRVSMDGAALTAGLELPPEYRPLMNIVLGTEME